MDPRRGSIKGRLIGTRVYLHKIPGRVKMIKAKDTAVLGASTTGRADTLEVGVTIVGVGNEFRGDDAVGLMVLKHFGRAYQELKRRIYGDYEE